MIEPPEIPGVFYTQTRLRQDQYKPKGGLMELSVGFLAVLGTKAPLREMQDDVGDPSSARRRIRDDRVLSGYIGGVRRERAPPALA